MRYYETLYIVDPNLDSKILEKTMTEIEQELSKTKSKVINHRVWDKKRLAYQILNHKYGSYIILQFEVGDVTKMVDFDVWMKLNNIVLRHMTVLLSQKPEIYEEETSDDGNVDQKKVSEREEKVTSLPEGEKHEDSETQSSKELDIKEEGE
tara:strand:- start:103 stop:555 length:453 start_codon:yes stop_codon:yes gene_type:complete